jgi:hypothetical protein
MAPSPPFGEQRNSPWIDARKVCARQVDCMRGGHAKENTAASS